MAKKKAYVQSRRDMKAARRFFRKAIGTSGLPEKITIDKSGANKAAVSDYFSSEEASIEISQNRYLNNLIEQDHRSIKQLFKATPEFKSFRTASITIRGFESIQMLRKKQVDMWKVRLPQRISMPSLNNLLTPGHRSVLF